MRQALICVGTLTFVFAGVTCPEGAAYADETGPGALTPAPTATAEVTEDSEEAARQSARDLAQEGLSLFDAGNYADALSRFDQASAVVHAPTMALMAARSLEKLGRLVEASERYLTVIRTPLPPDASPAFQSAVESAIKERTVLVLRIPTLKIALVGGTAEVTLDGKPLVTPAAPISLDPGFHLVVATSGTLVKTERVLLQPGEVRRVEISMTPPPQPVSALKVVGWTGVGVGAAALVFGAVTGGLAVSAKDKLDSSGCQNTVCPKGVPVSEVTHYNTLLVLANTGIVSGLVLGGLGGLGALLASRSTSANVSVQPWIGPSGGGFVGRF